MTIQHRTYGDLTAPDTSGMVDQVTAQLERVAARMADVKACVAVMRIHHTLRETAAATRTTQRTTKKAIAF